MSSLKRIFITGANTGIGLALSKQLAVEDKCHVFLGSRSEARGKEAVASILSEAPEAMVTLVVIDVSNEESVELAAASLEEHKPFHAIVNNAGVGLAHGVDAAGIIDVNLLGAKRVNDAFLHMVIPEGGRLVATSSGAASIYCQGEGWGKRVGGLSVSDRAPLVSDAVTWADITKIIESERVANYGITSEETKETHHSAEMAAYCLSKAALTAYYMTLAAAHPSLVVSSCFPGFINTNMTTGSGATLQPEEGTVSLRKCILGDLGACRGWYYGSDGLRSPLNVSRDPGEPEYQGE
jgi:carbonyl reductase 1